MDHDCSNCNHSEYVDGAGLISCGKWQRCRDWMRRRDRPLSLPTFWEPREETPGMVHTCADCDNSKHRDGQVLACGHWLLCCDWNDGSNRARVATSYWRPREETEAVKHTCATCKHSVGVPEGALLPCRRWTNCRGYSDWEPRERAEPPQSAAPAEPEPLVSIPDLLDELSALAQGAATIIRIDAAQAECMQARIDDLQAKLAETQQQADSSQSAATAETLAIAALRSLNDAGLPLARSVAAEEHHLREVLARTMTERDSLAACDGTQHATQAADWALVRAMLDAHCIVWEWCPGTYYCHLYGGSCDDEPCGTGTTRSEALLELARKVAATAATGTGEEGAV